MGLSGLSDIVRVVLNVEVDLEYNHTQSLQRPTPQAMAQFKKTGVRPMSRTGCCGLWGERYDVLDRFRDEMVELQDKIRIARDKALLEGSTPAW